MSELKIYGASDDLIEIEGDFTDEIECYNIPESYLAISDGTLLTVKYEGVWRFKLKSLASGSTFQNNPAPEDDDDNYSDVVTITSPREFRWVVLGEKAGTA